MEPTLSDSCEVCELITSPFLVRQHRDSVVLLYPDQAYPLRCVVASATHVAGPAGLTTEYLNSAQSLSFKVGQALHSLPTVIRANYAILGNREPDHFHWHVIPRYEGESNATSAPWPHDPKKLTELPEILHVAGKLKNLLDITLGPSDGHLGIPNRSFHD